MVSNSTLLEQHKDLADKLSFYLVLFIIVFAVIFRGGNRPLPLMVLEFLSVLLIVLTLFFPGKLNQSGKLLRYTVWLLLLFPLLFLLPVPWDLWVELPGRELYAKTLTILEEERARPVSIYPLKTEIAFLTLLLPVSIFITTLRLSVSRIKTAILVLLAVAFLEAILGLIQYGDGSASSLRFGNLYASNGAEGTYANRNHLAGLLEMVLPIGLGLLALSLGHTRSELRYHSNWRSRLTIISGFHMNKSIIYGFMCVVILLGLVFTQSRTGVALAMLGIFISTIAYAKRLGGTNVFGVIGTFTAVVIAIAAEIGLVPLYQRFAVDHLSNLRFTIYENTIKGIGTFFPVGSGPGTFPYLYPRFQSIEEKGFINHAHNDYLEWLMEGGIVAGLFLMIFLWLYVRRWPLVWVNGYWSTFRFMQVGAGIGVLLMILHGMTDFNLHIPANAVYFSFLAAVFFYPYQDKDENFVLKDDKKLYKPEPLKQESPLHVTVGTYDTNAINQDNKESPEDIPNPFSEEEKGKDA